ncbi:MAG: motility protein MotB [Micavibrio sp.]|nr:motility protein MotB [Micavibrio sp.]HCK32739.1 motility protein MotB [Rhodospirillaceae bacterium]|tara:strand:+ start:41 stop:1021 length:981 start_codon:yes stop_codon:yes gene_type:complete
MADKDEDKKEQPIIIKKINKGGGGHHGGAWKVAYADFVTAMMAFFLLMWLINVTTEEQKTGIADYFNPSTDPVAPRVSMSMSGADSVLSGQTIAPDGAMVTTNQPLVNTPEELQHVEIENIYSRVGNNEPTQAEIEEQETFDDIKEAIEQAVQNDPDLSELSKNLVIDETPEGLRIQIIDQEGKSMFPSGSAKMYPRMQQLLERVGKIISKADNEISIRGHTDSVPYNGRGGYTNWELSADRANATRKVLLNSGYSPRKLDEVVGKADTEHLFPEDPNGPRNRRISIILIKEAITKAKKGEGADSRSDYLRSLGAPRRSNSIINFD